jgi:hypothetical protein
VRFKTSTGKAASRILVAAGITGAVAIAAVGYGLSSADAATGRARALTTPTTVAPAASGANRIIGEWTNGYGKIVIQQTGTSTFTDTAVTALHLIGGSGCAIPAGTSQGTITGKGPSYSSSVTTYESAPSGTCAPASVADFAFTIEGAGNTLSETGETWTRVPMAVTTATVPNGIKGDFYSKTLGATGGTPPYYLWRLSSGALPKGLTLNELTGVISGTPTRVAKVTIKVRVTNLGLPSRPAPASSATKTFTLKIS